MNITVRVGPIEISYETDTTNPALREQEIDMLIGKALYAFDSVDIFEEMPDTEVSGALN